MTKEEKLQEELDRKERFITALLTNAAQHAKDYGCCLRYIFALQDYIEYPEKRNDEFDKELARLRNNFEMTYPH